MADFFIEGRPYTVIVCATLRISSATDEMLSFFIGNNYRCDIFIIIAFFVFRNTDSPYLKYTISKRFLQAYKISNPLLSAA